MRLKNYVLPCLAFLLLISCETEKDKLIVSYEALYEKVLNNDYTSIESHLTDKSIEFYKEVTAVDNLNIDGILALGEKYRLPYTLVEYLAYNGDNIKDGAPKEELFRYLGAQRMSIFSFQDGYYVDKPKLKKGKENFVALIKEEMSVSKRSWLKFEGDDTKGYKLDLLYTMELVELKKKKEKAKFRKQTNDKTTKEEYLRNFYWQHSGQNIKFEQGQLELEANMRSGRSELIQSYVERGLM